MKDKRIVIVDYDIGNIHSIKKVFSNFGKDAILSSDNDTIKNADGVILPGVGAFATAMKGLRERELEETIKEIARDNKPLLGICVGAQLLLSEGHEFGIHQGLGIIPGKVIKFDSENCVEKIPHIGWNSLESLNDGSWNDTILEGAEKGDSVYFVHSYYIETENENNILSTTKYGGMSFCSTVKKGNIYGCQFHPEKSGKVGLSIIRNFINIVES